MDRMWGGEAAGDAAGAAGLTPLGDGGIADASGHQPVDREVLDRQLTILSRVAAVLRHMRAKREQPCAA